MSLVALLALTLATSKAAQASPIYVRTANAAGGMSNTPAAISWTLDAAWTDVDISITFFNLFSYSGVPTGDVYLTNAIGAGTTAAANQIAFTTVTPSGGQFPTITTFSDLSLGPGTYYLLFARQTLGFFWALGDSGNYVVGPGVTAGPTYIGFKDVPLSGYAPATGAPYSADPSPLVFSITGDRQPLAPVPEPTSLMLLGTGISAVAAFRRKKRRQKQGHDGRCVCDTA